MLDEILRFIEEFPGMSLVFAFVLFLMLVSIVNCFGGF